jgi:hypothetical protein
MANRCTPTSRAQQPQTILQITNHQCQEVEEVVDVEDGAKRLKHGALFRLLLKMV